RKVFDEMPERPTVLWATMISGNAGEGMAKEALNVFEIMRREEEVSIKFSKICKPLFRKASWLRPKATRSSSRDLFDLSKFAV
ncbi:hypothetical protein Tsubulata_024735, partial [Turnera subulata]